MAWKKHYWLSFQHIYRHMQHHNIYADDLDIIMGIITQIQP